MSEKREFPILNGRLLSDLDANGYKIIGMDYEVTPEKIKEAVAPELEAKADKTALAAEVKRAKDAEAELDGRVEELEENPTVNVDDTLTKDGENPVKSKGIWSAIWGSFVGTAASVYDWVMTELGKKQDKLSEAQLAAANSGITAEKVRKLNGIEAGAQKNPDLSGYAKKTDIPAAPDLSAYAKTAEVLPRYPFVEKRVLWQEEFYEGKISVTPYMINSFEIGNYPSAEYTIEIEDGDEMCRDCVLVLEISEGITMPKFVFPTNFHPRTDAETDFACVAGVRNVYWISEYAVGEFVVAGWQETEGGNAE